jgi:hypothetical protein
MRLVTGPQTNSENMQMSTPANPTISEKKLTIDDPVEPELLAKFGQLQQARMQCAERLLDLKQEEVRVLRAAANVDAERQKIFEGLLLSRGLPPNFPVEIDAKTGKMNAIQGVTPDMVAKKETPENGAVKAS